MGASYASEATGKGAIITGGGSGIGLVVAHKCIELGMLVVIADINVENLASATKELEAVRSNSVLAVPTDVTSENDYTNLRNKGQAFFGIHPVGFVFLNAGIGLGPMTIESAWTTEPADFRKVIGKFFVLICYLF